MSPSCWLGWKHHLTNFNIWICSDTVNMISVKLCLMVLLIELYLFITLFGDLEDTSQWGAVDTEIKVPSGENTELKHSPFKACSRSVYSHTCHAYFHKFLPYFYPSSLFLHFFQNLPIFSCIGCSWHRFQCRPAEWNRSPCWMQVPMLNVRGI